MSHFPVLVLLGHRVPLKASADEIWTAVDQVLTPYDETIPVYPYQEPCICRGAEARAEAMAAVWDRCRARFPDLDVSPRPAPAALRSAHFEPFCVADSVVWQREHPAKSQHPAEIEAARIRYVDRLNRAILSLENKHPARARHDPTCNQCAGHGTVETTRNPTGFFDGWEIGGRWEGALSAHVLQRARSRVPARTVVIAGHALRRTTTDAFKVVVTPDGAWHANEVTAFVGTVVDHPAVDPGAFQRTKRVLLKTHADGLAVVVDCHI